MTKILKYFRLSDLFLFIGLCFFAPFLIFKQYFVTNQNPNNVGFPLAAIIVCFTLVIASWVTYLVLEHKQGNFNKNLSIIILGAIALINLIVILCQPSNISLKMDSINQTSNQIAPINIDISPTHKTFFLMEAILICFALLIGFTVFSKRFKAEYTVPAICLIGILVFFIFNIYSYFTEGQQYIEFVKHLFSGSSLEELTNYTVKSFTVHRNGYGMVLLVGIILATIIHSYNEKPINYGIMIFFMINMLFTLSKGSLLIGALVIIAYVYFRLFYTINENRKRNLLLIVIYSIILITTLVLFVVSNATKGEVLGFLYSNGIFDTLKSRTLIWKNAFQNLSGGKWLIGRGYGIINLIIYPMNLVNGDNAFAAHNVFIELLGEGGIFFLGAYIFLLAYSILKIVKYWNKSPNTFMTLSIGVAAFFIYGFIESNQFMIYIFLIIIFIYINTIKTKEIR